MENIITKLNEEIKKFAIKTGKKVNIGKFNSKTGNMKIEFYDDCITDNVDISPLDKSRFDLADKVFNLRKLGIDLGKKFLNIEKSNIKSLKKVIGEFEIVGANPNAREKIIEVISNETGKRNFMTINDVLYRINCPATFEELEIERGNWEYDESGKIVRTKTIEDEYWDSLNKDK